MNDGRDAKNEDHRNWRYTDEHTWSWERNSPFGENGAAAGARLGGMLGRRFGAIGEAVGSLVGAAVGRHFFTDASRADSNTER